MNKYNFNEILSNEVVIEDNNGSHKYTFNGIQIPKIQRDYAQGRKEEGEIRKRFINALIGALEKGENLELDFVYGSITEIDKKKYFIPLDGQQRLTTLFLLHWYIGNRELSGDQLKALRENIARFSYDTRNSARNFCEQLSKLSITFDKNPSDEIENASWFYKYHKNDPTVRGMLVMLDAIHEKYREVNKALYSSLSKLTFYILPLDGFNLSDELYIKMNARGKQLTDFENFKADLINWLQDNKNPFAEEFHQEVDLNDRKMPYYLSFSSKLDNEWTNLFWKYTKVHDKSEDKLVDPYFVRFWNRYLLNYFIIQNNQIAQEAIERETAFQRLYGNEESFKYESFDLYKTLFENNGVIKNIDLTFDRLAIHYDEINEVIKASWDGNGGWNLFEKQITQAQRILLLAVSLYIEKNDFNRDNFKNWIRVVWNIIIDPDIRSIRAMVNIMRLINKLSEGSGDIYNFLTTSNCLQIIHNENSFAKAQLEEERHKAHLILLDSSWESELIEAEKHQLFLGNISFLLQGDPDRATFKHRFGIAKDLLSSKGPKDEFNRRHLLVRAVISKLQDWDDLVTLNLGDNPDNWQLMIRRNKKIQSIICGFCDLIDAGAVLIELNKLIVSKSQITGWSTDTMIVEKAKYIHENIYQEEEFHNWIQDHKAFNLKWKNDHIFIHRPSSWYDWVGYL